MAEADLDYCYLTTTGRNSGKKLGRKTYPGMARLVKDKEEDAKARRLLVAKYQGWAPGKRLSGWANNSLAVAVDLRR